MPAVSKAQQRFMGMVRAAKKGEMKNPSPEVADAAASMTKKMQRICIYKTQRITGEKGSERIYWRRKILYAL